MMLLHNIAVQPFVSYFKKTFTFVCSQKGSKIILNPPQYYMLDELHLVTFFHKL